MGGRIASELMTPRSGATNWSFGLVASKLSFIVNLRYRILSIFFIERLPRKANMSYQAIKEYLCRIALVYKNSNRQKKSQLLDHAGEITDLSRKHLIRVLKKPGEEILRVHGGGRKKTYDPAVLLPHIKKIWFVMERISAKRLKVAIPDIISDYKHPDFTLQMRMALERISASTLDRMLRKIRAESIATKGLSTTSPSRYMKNKIPLNTLDYKVTGPGFFQSDTVAHCGTNAGGKYISSITFTDVHSGWTENRAIASKKGTEVRNMFQDIRSKIPIKIRAINTDSGSEFLNTPVFNFMHSAPNEKPITFTRSRPYKKNDSCYVEQKNFTHVRELFGYERFEHPRLVELMNDIYINYWSPLQNFFIPTFKLKEKIRVGATIKKKYYSPETPYSRLINSPDLTDEQKKKLREIKQQLNAFTLHGCLEEKLAYFFSELKKTKIEREAA